MYMSCCDNCRHPVLCFIWERGKLVFLFTCAAGLYVTNITNVTQISTGLTLSSLCLSPGQHCLCWATATITSRISPTLQSATSSSPSCTRRWRSTRCTTPSPCTKLVLILRPPRPPSCSTTPAATRRYTHTHTHSHTHTTGFRHV